MSRMSGVVPPVNTVRNWWYAKPWQTWPLWRKGWHYHEIWRGLRACDKSRSERWWRRLWWTVSFPHEHPDSPSDVTTLPSDVER